MLERRLEMSRPTEKQVNAVFNALSLLSDGYRLVNCANHEFTIEATLDVFTPSFIRLLIDELGESTTYDLTIGKDILQTGLRTQLKISFP